MKVLGKIGIGLIAMLMLVISCEDNNEENLGEGNLKLSLTDAPIDAENVTGVYITFSEIYYNKNQESWQKFEEFEGPKTFNLLELTNGDTAVLGDFSMGAGNYAGIRLMLDAVEKGANTENRSNPGCYLEFKDGTTQPLFVPSGEQTGYKMMTSFAVPSNGTVSLTADFNARKSVRKAGNSGMYILRPTIRLIANDAAGTIAGNVQNAPDSSVVVYAYEDGTYVDSVETADPAEDETRFPNSVSSTKVADSSYKLAFLAPETYDLVVAATLDGEFKGVLKLVEDVTVNSDEVTNHDIDLQN